MKKYLIWLVSLALVLSGCVSGDTQGDYGPNETEKLVLCTSHKQEVWWPIVREFENRTGIWVEVIEGGTLELLEQLEEGTLQADVLFGGGVESLESYSTLFAPYTSRYNEDILPQYRCEEGIWTPFSTLPVVLIYNPKLLPAGAVSGWQDLFAPELKGKIAFADPNVSASSFTALATMVQALGRENADMWLQTFAASLDGKQIGSSGEVLSTVTSGECLVGITIEETALRYIGAGEPLGMVYPADGTSSVPDGSAILAKAAHSENAQAFVDFTVSQDVQSLIQQQFFRRSVRRDLAQAADLPSLSTLTQVDYDTHWAGENRDKLLMSWQFYFGTEEEQ